MHSPTVAPAIVVPGAMLATISEAADRSGGTRKPSPRHWDRAGYASSSVTLGSRPCRLL